MQKTTVHPRSFYALASALSFVLCMSVLVYGGPYRQFVRSSIGDVLAVVFLYFLLGVVRPGSLVLRATVTCAVAFAIEGAQLTGITPKDAPMPVQLMFGSHFDPWDLFAYTVGLVLAVAIDYGVAAYRNTASSTHNDSQRFSDNHE